MIGRFIEGGAFDGTLSDTNNLASVLMTKPEMADTIIYAYANAEGRENNVYNILHSMLQGTGRSAEAGKGIKTIGSREYMWHIKGSVQTARTITEPVQGDGYGFSRFILPLDIQYFSKGMVLRFEDGSTARVQEEPYMLGSSVHHVMVLMGASKEARVAGWALEPGKKVSKIFTAFEEGSEGGGMLMDTPAMLKNQINTLRTSGTMTGDAKMTKTVLQLKTKGKLTNYWLFQKQNDMYEQHWGDVERALWFSRYNKLYDGSIPMQGSNGNVIFTGSGIEEQLEGTNYYSVSELTEDLFRHMATTISGKMKGGVNKKILLVTGNGGCDEFDKLWRKMAATMRLTDTTFVTKLEGAKLRFGANFTSYIHNGVEFTVINHPMFNDFEVFPGVVGPGYTSQSYKMYFLDFSEYDGIPNIEMITRGAEGEDRSIVQWFTAGGATPNFSYKDSKNDIGASGVLRSNGTDAFSMYMLSQAGVKIANPYSCGLIKLTPPQIR